MRDFVVVATLRMKLDSRRCVVSGFLALDPVGLFSPSLHTVGRAGGAIGTSVGQAELPSTLVC